MSSSLPTPEPVISSSCSKISITTSTKKIPRTRMNTLISVPPPVLISCFLKNVSWFYTIKAMLLTGYSDGFFKTFLEDECLNPHEDCFLPLLHEVLCQVLVHTVIIPNSWLLISKVFKSVRDKQSFIWQTFVEYVPFTRLIWDMGDEKAIKFSPYPWEFCCPWKTYKQAKIQIKWE